MARKAISHSIKKPIRKKMIQPIRWRISNPVGKTGRTPILPKRALGS